MIKDTNPDHYKVGDANFIEYMNDPKINGFGNWMFANGYNLGVWASSNWISVKDRLPEESGTYLCYQPKVWYICAMNTVRWSTQHGWLGKEVGSRIEGIEYWMPLPEPPKEETK